MKLFRSDVKELVEIIKETNDIETADCFGSVLDKADIMIYEENREHSSRDKYNLIHILQVCASWNSTESTIYKILELFGIEFFDERFNQSDLIKIIKRGKNE